MDVSVKTGISITGVLAAVLSWCLNKSIVWAVFHFFFGLLYLIYAALFRTSEVEALLKGIGG